MGRLDIKMPCYKNRKLHYKCRTGLTAAMFLIIRYSACHSNPKSEANVFICVLFVIHLCLHRRLEFIFGNIWHWIHGPPIYPGIEKSLWSRPLGMGKYLWWANIGGNDLGGYGSDEGIWFLIKISRCCNEAWLAGGHWWDYCLGTLLLLSASGH